MPVQVQGPDGNTYQFPDGTDKNAAIAYFKKKGIGAPVSAPTATVEAQPTFGQKLTSLFTHPLNSMEAASQPRMRPRDASIPEMAATDLYNVGAGATSVVRHPIRTVGSILSQGFGVRPVLESAINAVTGKPLYQPVPIVPTNPEEGAYAGGQTLGLAGLIKAFSEVAGAARNLRRGVAKEAGDVAVGTGTAPVRALVKETETGNEAAATKAADAQRGYNRKVGEIIKGNRKIAEQQGGRAEAEAQLTARGQQVGYDVRKLDTKLRAQDNANYEAVREKVADATVPRADVQEPVKAAMGKLRGSPERIPEFNAIMARGARTPEMVLADQTAENMGYKNFAEAISDPQMRDTLSRVLPAEVFKAATESAGAPMTFNDLQGFYEELGAKLSSGNLDGDVFQAVKQARTSIGKIMDKMADDAGVGPQFQAAKAFHRQYMETFHEPTGPSGSGSPVAQALLAEDPTRALKPFLGDSGDRGVNFVREYDPALADRIEEVRRINREKPPITRTEKKPLTSLKPPPSAEKSVIETGDISAAKRAPYIKRAETIRGIGWRLGLVWPVLDVMRDVVAGHPPSVVGVVGGAGAIYGGANALASLLEKPGVVEFFTRATPEDVAQIPPNLRGASLKAVVKAVQSQGIKVSPTLLAAVGLTAIAAPRKRVAAALAP